jgi:hypothetical protein
MNTLSITVDIEDWYHIPSVTGSPFSVYKDVNAFFDKWEGRYDYLSEPMKGYTRWYNLKSHIYIFKFILEGIVRIMR